MVSSLSCELSIPARQVRAGDRLVPSGARIVAVSRTASGDILITSESGSRMPMPEATVVIVCRAQAPGGSFEAERGTNFRDGHDSGRPKGLSERPRRFGARARVAFALASGGTCEVCGDELKPGWHADHVEPWSKGGETKPANGRATCPTCNLRRGNRS